MNKITSEKIDQLLAAVEAKDKYRSEQGIHVKDIRWNTFSEESQEVLLHFGIDAPHKLNVYSCSVEDALFELGERLVKAKKRIKELEATIEQLSGNKEDLE